MISEENINSYNLYLKKGKYPENKPLTIEKYLLKFKNIRIKNQLSITQQPLAVSTKRKRGKVNGFKAIENQSNHSECFNYFSSNSHYYENPYNFMEYL